MPFQILGMWLRPLLTLALLGIGIYLVVTWAQRYDQQTRVDTRDLEIERTLPEDLKNSREPVRTTQARTDINDRRRERTQIGLNSTTALLAGGIALILTSISGGWISTVPFLKRGELPSDDDRDETVTRIVRPDGTELHISFFGNADGVPIILTHGWGLDSREWIYARKELASRCRIIAWDLPGLGRSKAPANNDFSLEKLARDLDEVVKLAGPRPVILAGHSIGGMIILTYARLFHGLMSERVAGLVLGQTTYTNPVATTSMAAFYRAIQKPVLEPLCYLMIGLAPIMWLLNWWSYLTGSIHRTNHKSFFSGEENRQQLGFISRYSIQAWPATVARGFLAMFHYDATATLPTIAVPTLVIGGERDVTCKNEASVTMSQSIPNARLMTLATARHGGVFEFHQQFAEAIHQFISTSLPLYAKRG